MDAIAGAQKNALKIAIVAILFIGLVVLFVLWRSAKENPVPQRADTEEEHGDYLSIPELDVRIKLSSGIKDLTYQMSPDKMWAYVYTRSLIAEERTYGASYCDMQSGLGAIGVSRVLPPAGGPQPHLTIKLPDDYYAEYWHPEAVCTRYPEVIPLALEQKAKVIEAFKTVERIP